LVAKKRLVAIKKYFFGETPLAECKDQLDALTESDKQELGPLCEAALNSEKVEVVAETLSKEEYEKRQADRVCPNK
jgi:hypothetical protein